MNLSEGTTVTTPFAPVVWGHGSRFDVDAQMADLSMRAAQTIHRPLQKKWDRAGAYFGSFALCLHQPSSGWAYVPPPPPEVPPVPDDTDYFKAILSTYASLLADLGRCRSLGVSTWPIRISTICITPPESDRLTAARKEIANLIAIEHHKKPVAAPKAPAKAKEPVKAFPRPDTPEWGKMNVRRGELIHKYLMGTLTADETAEYEYLQRESLAAVEEAFPFFDQEDEEYERELEVRLKKAEAKDK